MSTFVVLVVLVVFLVAIAAATGVRMRVDVGMDCHYLCQC